MKPVAVLSTAFVSALAMIVGLISIGAGGGSGTAVGLVAVAATLPCVTTGPLSGLSEPAATNARIVVAVAESLGGTAGARIAILAAYTESGLLVLGNTNVDTHGVPVEGEGSDHDSLGLFQQRASWGSATERLDPIASTQLFMQHLLADPGWASKQPWVAAQDVQRSAYDGQPRAANHDSAVYGGNYQAHIDLADATVTQIEADAAHQQCGALHGGRPANTAPGSHGLPDNYRIPSSASADEATVVAFAIAQLDKPYVFGAAGPDAYDCSGLTMAAWAQVGVALTHEASVQSVEGSPTTASALLPGDLVLVPGDDGTLAAPGHVGLYIGAGLVLNAADEQIGIRVQTFDNFVAVGHGLSALRHIR